MRSAALNKLRGLLGARLAPGSLSTFAGGGTGAFAARVLYAALTLLLYLLAVRVAGEVEYGRYVYVYSWATILSMVAAQGLDLAALRFVASLTATEQWRELKGFARGAPAMVLAVSGLLSALVAALTLAAGDRLSAGLATAIVAGCGLLPLMTLLQLFAFMVRGQKRSLSSLIPQSMLRPLLLIGLLGAVTFHRPGNVSAAHLVALDALATGVALLAAVGLFWRGYPAAGRNAQAQSDLSSWLRIGLPLALQSTVRLSMNKADIVMIGLLVGTTASGVYALASQISALVAFPLAAANTIAAPLFAELHVTGDKRELQRLVTFASRSVTGAAGAIALGAILVTPWILELFGGAFREAYLPVVILTIGQLVNAASGSVGYLLGMSGEERVAARMTLGAGALNLLLNGAMIPFFGAVGAALATAISGIVWNVLLVRRVRVALGIRSTVLG